MLKKTFCHIEGISENSEKILWKNNINSWNEFLNNFENISCLPLFKLKKIKSELYFSNQKLKNGDILYFKDKLSSKIHHRLVNYGKIAYLDIETTGLSKYTDIITMIGIYDGKTAKSYVAGFDLEKAYEKLKQYDIIVTFNGKCFDMPFIEYKSKQKFNYIHLDLRYMLKEFGLSGGLKKIEKQLNIVRDKEVAEVDGFEAVRLWRRYKKGDKEALRILLKYNKEDIINLKYLLNWYLDKKKLEY